MPKNFAVPMVLQDIDVSTLVNPALWYAINPLGLEQAALIVRLVNLSDVNVTIGIGEQTAHIFLPADSAPVTIELQKNNEPTNVDFLIKKGTIFWAQGAGAQGNGNVYLSGWLRSRD